MKTVKIFYILLLLSLSCLGQNDSLIKSKRNMINKLTSHEKHVLIDKGTEAPFSGKYNETKAEGLYVCKMCDAPLYTSEHKFVSTCGWPSFDDEIKGAIKRVPDADGRRTEIVCSNCGGHLGHVFKGEFLTEKNLRHCVNSVSMKFIPKKEEIKEEVIYLAGGCFWGTEYYYKNLKGVIRTSVGFTGGSKEKITYKEVCSGTTGHAEVVEVVYDKNLIEVGEIIKLFFEIHDCTQINRQGPDIGEQYRSEIFYTTEQQKEVSNKIIDILISKGYEVATILTKAGVYYKAEEYHQDYYNKKGGTPTCHFRQKIF